MRVSIVVYADYPSSGGLENLVSGLVENLSKSVEVHVVCTGLGHRNEIPAGVKCFPILRTTNLRYMGFLAISILNLVSFCRYVVQNRPNVVNAHPCYPSGLFSLPARFLGVPLVCTSHGGDILVDRSVRYGVRLNPFKALLLRLTLAFCSIHTIVSDSMRPDAIAAGSNDGRIRVIHNGTKVNEIPQSSETGILDRGGVVETDFLILYLGRLHPVKRPTDLVEAIPGVLKSVPNAKVVLAGEGPEEVGIRNIISRMNLHDSVRLVGHVSDAEKLELLRRCQVLVLPSVVEAFGISVIEAMACEKPVIVTDIGAFKEIVRPGETGLLVPRESPDAIAGAISLLASDEALRRRMGLAARRDAMARFDIGQITNEYLQTYKDAIDLEADKRFTGKIY